MSYARRRPSPAGSTQFRFQAGNLDVQSTGHQWLIADHNGTSAQPKGTATVNSTSGYAT